MAKAKAAKAKAEDVAEKVGAEVVGVFYKDAGGQEHLLREYRADDETHNMVSRKVDGKMVTEQKDFVKKAEDFAEKMSAKVTSAPGKPSVQMKYYVKKLQ